MSKHFFTAVVLSFFVVSARAETVLEILEQVQANTKTVKTVQADFVQEKTMQVFSKPLVIKGSLYLQKPDKFSWRTKSPMRYVMVSRAGTIKQWDDESRQVQEFSLTKNPAFSTAFNQMQGWFSGDYVALQKDYNIAVVSRKPLVLIFSPKPTMMAYGIIENVKVSFRDDMRYLSAIEIKEKNSDVTVINFLHTKIDLPINAKAWEVKSGV